MSVQNTGLSCANRLNFLMFSSCTVELVLPSHSPFVVFKVRLSGICDSVSCCAPAGVCGQKSGRGWDLKGRGSAARIMVDIVGFAAFYHNIHIFT